MTDIRGEESKATEKSCSQEKAKSPSKFETEKLVVNEKEKKKQAFITRSIWSLVMIFGFLILIASGHLALIGIVYLFQVLTFKEIIGLTSEPARDKNIPYSRSLNWYFLFVTLYYLDGESYFDFFQEQVYASRFLTTLVLNHKFISYSLFITGLIFFVFSLTKGYYKFQFAQLCITHMTLLLVVVQSHLIADNILNGIIWFLLPCSLVIVNDVFAYLCGITFGRTQLLEISPKKTVEGFVGAWICTGIAAVFFTYFLTRSDYMICPAENITSNIFNFPECEPNPVFIPQFYQLPKVVSKYLHVDMITFKPIHFHSAMLATFASLIAPFGGFFASGLKRAFGIKDFGDTIPGHGGITDRMDCQFLMGSFSYLYYQTFISVANINVGKILQTAILNLSVAQLLQLIKSLLRYLHSIGVIDDEKLRSLFGLLEI
ncbi:uncharacterized protein PRCAT00003568001 [Priceomyces carsonii]|uniref:uncharacterized protein n=1 Tax=Priceomyces carsonii TaxID=28549 RepID=UPI002ED7D9D7|nr:unnamed protein product [Priceomyces carsonii]